MISSRSLRSSMGFQSTLPRGERPKTLLEMYQEKCISIHAPARGATDCYAVSNFDFYISIHAPARGATRKEGTTMAITLISIHAPARGATVYQNVYSFGAPISIHAPARGATCKPKQIKFSLHISIHAPARGATVFNFPWAWAKQDFNPRSREGSDIGQELSGYKPRIFQSTLPRGERHIPPIK